MKKKKIKGKLNLKKSIISKLDAKRIKGGNAKDSVTHCPTTLTNDSKG